MLPGGPTDANPPLNRMFARVVLLLASVSGLIASFNLLRAEAMALNARAPAMLARSVAVAASSIPVNETAHLHLVSHKNAILQEQGLASGTFNCPLAIQLTISSTTVGISFTCTPHGGSISGTAKASFYVAGAVARFSGRLSIRHGTGTYAHASGAALQIKGTIRRETYALTVQVNGRMRT